MRFVKMGALVLVGFIQCLIGVLLVLGLTNKTYPIYSSSVMDGSTSSPELITWIWAGCAMLGFGLLLWNQAIRILKGRGTSTFTIGVIGWVLLTAGGASAVMTTWNLETMMLVSGGVITIIAAAIPFTASQSESL